MFTSAFVLSSSCLGDKNRAEAAAILSTLLTVARRGKKPWFSDKCVRFGGTREGHGGLMGVEKRVFKARI